MKNQVDIKEVNSNFSQAVATIGENKNANDFILDLVADKILKRHIKAFEELAK
ncbi:MAG: hypothetical protein FWG64_11130 [Firmicutes bacterium]|nr:hypothetical protein [Bacillota bacterium]